MSLRFYNPRDFRPAPDCRRRAAVIPYECGADDDRRTGPCGGTVYPVRPTPGGRRADDPYPRGHAVCAVHADPRLYALCQESHAE